MWYQGPYDHVVEELDKIRQRLAAIDVGVLRVDPKERALASEIRAFCYVWVAACLERGVTDLLSNLLKELNDRSLPINSLKPGLLGLALDKHLESVGALRDHEKLWSRVCTMFGEATALQPAVFDLSVLPLDGRTLKPSHFRVLWQVFDFPGQPLPSALHAVALEDLSEGRNLVAHGEEDPTHFGRRKTPDTLRRLIERTEDVFIHLVTSADAYLSAGDYIRKDRE